MIAPTPELAAFIEKHGFRLPRLISEVIPERSQADRQVIGVLAQRGEKTTISAHPKTGKTSTVRSAIGMMERGWENPWGKDLGSIIKGKALVVTEEPDSIWDEWRDNLSLRDHVSILNARDVLGGSWFDICMYVAALVNEYNFDLVVVDTITAFASIQNENDNSEVTAVMKTANIITDTDAALLMIHHLRKAKGGSGLQTRGGGAFNACVETPIEMRRVKGHSRRRRFRTYSRHGYIPPVFDLELDDGLYRRVDGPSDGPSACEKRQSIIVGLLPTEAPGLEWAEIRAAWPAGETKPSQSRLADSLKAAESQGRIASDGRTAGDKIRRRYWRPNLAVSKGSTPVGIVTENADSQHHQSIPIGDNIQRRDIGTVGHSAGLNHPNGQGGLRDMTAAMLGGSA